MKMTKPELKDYIQKYVGVENAKKQQVLRLLNDFFGVSGSNDRPQKFADFGMILAGGTINSIYSGRPVNDLDFYLRDMNQWQAVVDYCAEIFGKCKYETDNAITFERKVGKKKFEVQIIKRFSGTPREILDTFDFTIVQGCYDFLTEQFVLDDNFLPHIAQRVLKFTSTSHYPICALIRTRKYQDRGYFIPNSTLLAISFAINRLDLSTYKELKDQLLGIDTMFLCKFLETLDDNETLTDSDRAEFIDMCCTLIDNAVSEIFNESGDGESDTVTFE